MFRIEREHDIGGSADDPISCHRTKIA